MEEISEYERQAIDFLDKTQTVLSVKYLSTDKYFPDDKEVRDIYEVQIMRNGRHYTFKFGNSIQSSGKFIVRDRGVVHMFREKKQAIKEFPLNSGATIKENKDFSIPSAYSVLCCLQKYDPGSFEDFCSDLGYDEDSRKAEKIYHAVREEYLQIARLFNEQELEMMQEIQ